MQMPTALRNLDDRVLGRRNRSGRSAGAAPQPSPGQEDAHRGDPDRGTDRGTDRNPDGGTDHATDHRESERTATPRRPAGDVVREVLSVVWRVSRAVFLALALVAFLGIVLTFAPTNDQNVIVRTLLSWAETVAGPFRDVFTADTPRRELLYNYALATGVYVLAASLVSRLPGRRGVG